MSPTIAPTQLRRRAALARLEAEKLADAVVELRAASRSKVKLDSIVERLEALSARMQEALDLPGGVTVAQAAERLDVSEPTVRKWLDEGLLARVAGRKPVEISQRSVIDVERVLGSVRESYPARRWSEALGAFLHDRDLLGKKWAREGVEQLRRGELVER
jgi:excisionase family DNA binding protein